MEEIMITLSDGTSIKNLELNGNNFIAQNVISSDLFTDDNLLNVKITKGDQVEEHTNMKLVQNMNVDGKSWFILADKTPEEIKEIELNAKIEFLMAMQGVTE